MMRPQSVALPPRMPTGLTATKIGTGSTATVQLDWIDSSIADTQSLLQVSGTETGPWMTLETYPEPLLPASLADNYTGPRTYTDAAGTAADWNFYRVVAQNTIGYGGQFMDLTAESATLPVQVPATPIASVDPTSLDFGSLQVGTSLTLPVTLSNAGRVPLTISSITAPAGFTQTNDCGTALAAAVDAATPSTCTISVTFAPTTIVTSTGDLVIATDDPLNPTLAVALSGTGVDLPAAPSVLRGTAVRLPVGDPDRLTLDLVTLTWTDNSINETGFNIERAQVTGTQQSTCRNPALAYTRVGTVGANVTTYSERATRTGTLCYRVQSFNSLGGSAWITWLVTTP